jgi:hypothetical protein
MIKEKLQSRLYFHNNKMIRCLNQDNKIINPNSKEFIEVEQSVLSDYKKYLSYLVEP